MASEYETDRMVYKLIGDGSSYQKMLEEAEKGTIETTTSIKSSLEKVEGLGKNISDKVSSAFGMLETVGMKDVSKALGHDWENVTERISTTSEKVKKKVAEEWEELTTDGVFGKVISGAKGVGNALKSITSQGSGANELGGLGNFITVAWEKAKATVGHAIDTISGTLSTLAVTTKTAWEATKKFGDTYLTFSALTSGATTALTAAKTGIVTGTIAMYSWTKSVIASTAANIANMASLKGLSSAFGKTGAAATAAGSVISLSALKAAGIWGAIGATVAGAAYIAFDAVTAYSQRHKELQSELEKAAEKQDALNTKYREATTSILEVNSSFVLAEDQTKHLWENIKATNKEQAKAKENYDEAKKTLDEMQKIRPRKRWTDYFGLSEDSKRAEAEVKKAKGILDAVEARSGELYQKLMDTTAATTKELTKFDQSLELKLHTRGLDEVDKKFFTLRQQILFAKQAADDLLEMGIIDDDQYEEMTEEAVKAERTLQGIKEKAEEIKNLDWADSITKGIKEMSRGFRDSIDFFGESDTDKKLRKFREEIELMSLLSPGATEVIDELFTELGKATKLRNDAESFKSLNSEIERITKRANEITEKFRDPMEKMTDEVEEIQELFDAFLIDPETYAKAMEEIEKRYLGIEDAAKKAKDSIKSVDAALLGSAEATARIMAYQESIRFTPQIAAAGVKGPGIPNAPEEAGWHVEQRYRETGPPLPDDLIKERARTKELLKKLEDSALKQDMEAYRFGGSSFAGPLTDTQIARGELADLQAKRQEEIVRYLKQIAEATAKTAEKDPIEIDDADLDE